MVIPASPLDPISCPTYTREIILYKALTNIPATAGAENLISNLDKVFPLKGFFCVSDIACAILYHYENKAA